jgi:hypothetical protein
LCLCRQKEHTTQAKEKEQQRMGLGYAQELQKEERLLKGEPSRAEKE